MQSKPTHGIASCSSCGHVCPARVDDDGEITPLGRNECSRCRNRTFRRVVVPSAE